ncbi:MAG TPA: hypothetical protein PLH02_02180 [Bacillota bacterium]|nr:hypothetical protein [Bacillota bacterium]HPF42183.1 hypothetical protein [Bacillota bacterium]HPJ85688.1 hypothetical protein [Bacillota bacterium]HPQ61675.1 hypothetical protein [Bacillota bacterium]HRX91830.1 hypothetical protein [Candidatus Izemoplasmatales bacterium]
MSDKKQKRNFWISFSLYMANVIAGVVLIVIYKANISHVITISIYLVILSAFFSYYIRKKN